MKLLEGYGEIPKAAARQPIFESSYCRLTTKVTETKPLLSVLICLWPLFVASVFSGESSLSGNAELLGKALELASGKVDLFLSGEDIFPKQPDCRSDSGTLGPRVRPTLKNFVT